MDQDHAEPPTGFAGLGLAPALVETLAALGYEEPTPIQEAAIPPVLAGRDLVGQAATGTGKTAAFALPLLQRLSGEPRGPSPAALVLVPTRELAVQVAEAVHRYGRSFGARVVAVYGGQPISRQLRALRQGVDVVVATPGRALDHVQRGSLVLGAVRVVVLDEADEMLDMGFADELDALLEATPADTRQTVLFSATLPPRAAEVARRHLRDPVRVQVARAQVPAGEAPAVRQVAYRVARPWKLAALARVLDVEDPVAAIVFCRTRGEVDEITEALLTRGHRADALHGGLSQDQRDRVMARLHGRASDVLVATDIAARGLDVEHLTHVVNLEVPSSPEAYVHRIGRVGRAGREGVAVTLVEPREERLLRILEQHTRQRISREPLPTLAHLHARRLDTTRRALLDALEDEAGEGLTALVDDLAADHDLRTLAIAAVRLIHEASATPGEDEDEIPEPRAPRHADRDDARGRRERRPRPRPDARDEAPPEGWTRLQLSVGREAGVAPRDLVGAIAGETGIRGDEVGAIKLAERSSFVDVRAEVADRVLERLPGARIKGRKVQVRKALDR